MIFFPGNKPQPKRLRWIWSVPAYRFVKRLGVPYKYCAPCGSQSNCLINYQHWAMQAGSIPFEHFCLSQNVKPINKDKKSYWVNIPKDKTPKHHFFRTNICLLINCVANNCGHPKNTVSTFPSIPEPPISTTQIITEFNNPNKRHESEIFNPGFWDDPILGLRLKMAWSGIPAVRSWGFCGEALAENWKVDAEIWGFATHSPGN